MSAEDVDRVHAVLTGRAIPYTRAGTLSAIAKQPRPGRTVVEINGLEGDEQGDAKIHGGPDKAVHFYAYEHYPRWIDELGAIPVLSGPGAFGENLSTHGVDESTICLGDRLRIGSATLEVSQARQPCWKLNDRFGVPTMARMVQATARTGWYCRVVSIGDVSAGDGIWLLERPYPEWPLARLLRLFYGPWANRLEYVAALDLPLVASWRRLLERRLETGQVEDWGTRLDGPASAS